MTSTPEPSRPARSEDGPGRAIGPPEALLAVVGAHLRGQPLHAHLQALGAELVRSAHTAAAYRMVALPAVRTRRGQNVPERPGLLRAPVGGASLEAEVYRLDACALGKLLLTVARPLAIGVVELDDGSEVLGFVCEGDVSGVAPDITEHGGWRGYLAACGSG